MRFLLASALVLSLARPVSAEPCKASLDALAAFMDNLESLGRDASTTALSCAFHGPNDAAFDKLKTRYTKVFSVNIADPPAGCAKDNRELAVTFRVIAEAMGERVGIAFRQCSSKAQAKIADMRKQGKSDEEIGAVMKEMVQPIADSVGK